MAGSAKRERQLAREHYQRQQARRAAVASRRRRLQQVATVVVAALVLVGGIVALSIGLRGGEDKVTASPAKTPKPSASAPASASPSASVSPSASASPSATAAAAGCTYTKTGDASKDVGLPTYDVKKAASYQKPFTATLATSVGDIVIAVAADKAPCTATSFRHLADTKFYDNSPCHRLTTDNIFVLQCGDPTGQGSGGPGYQYGVENPPADGVYKAGTVAMARTADPGTNGSQFFLVYKDTTLPDANGYTVFGAVTEGLDVVQKVADAGVTGGGGDGAPATKVTITSVTVGKG